MAYNLEKIQELSGGDSDFIKDVIEAFIMEIPDDLKNLAQAVEAGNYEEIYQVSHKIKPNLDLLGMERSYALNMNILEWAKAASNLEDIAATFQELHSKVTENIEELKKGFNL